MLDGSAFQLFEDDFVEFTEFCYKYVEDEGGNIAKQVRDGLKQACGYTEGHAAVGAHKLSAANLPFNFTGDTVDTTVVTALAFADDNPSMEKLVLHIDLHLIE